MNKKKRTLLIIGIAAAIVVAAFILIFVFTRPQGSAGSKQVSVTVIDNESIESSLTLSTDAEFLAQLMSEAATTGKFSFESESGPYGMTIISINGIEADFNKDAAYWSILVNGEYGMYGADAQPVNDGDVFTFKYELMN